MGTKKKTGKKTVKKADVFKCTCNQVFSIIEHFKKHKLECSSNTTLENKAQASNNAQNKHAAEEGNISNKDNPPTQLPSADIYINKKARKTGKPIKPVQKIPPQPSVKENNQTQTPPLKISQKAAKKSINAIHPITSKNAQSKSPAANFKSAAPPSVHQVERILNKRMVGDRTEYLLKWKEFPDSENSWEPVENISCERLLKEFEDTISVRSTGSPLKRPLSSPIDPSPKKAKNARKSTSKLHQPEPTKPVDESLEKTQSSARKRFINNAKDNTSLGQGQNPSPEQAETLETLREMLVKGNTRVEAELLSVNEIEITDVTVPNPNTPGVFIPIDTIEESHSLPNQTTPAREDDSIDPEDITIIENSYFPIEDNLYPQDKDFGNDNFEISMKKFPHGNTLIPMPRQRGRPKTSSYYAPERSPVIPPMGKRKRGRPRKSESMAMAKASPYQTASIKSHKNPSYRNKNFVMEGDYYFENSDDDTYEFGRKNKSCYKRRNEMWNPLSTVQLIESELPLSMVDEDVMEELKGSFLFRQVLSVSEGRSCVCLLCEGVKSNPVDQGVKRPMFTFHQVKTLINHYRKHHGIDATTSIVDFSENEVFGVLPDSVDKSSFQSICQFCDDVIETWDAHSSHYSEKHGKTFREVPSKDQDAYKSLFFCSLCPSSATDMKSHKEHMISAHDINPHSCTYCPFFSATRDAVVKHLVDKHPEEQNRVQTQCFVCNFTAPVGKYLGLHIFSVHAINVGVNTWACNLCKQFCTTSDNIVEHLRDCCKNNWNDEEVVEEVDTKLDLVGGHSCLFCNNNFASGEMYLKHLHYVHMQWVDETLPDFSEQEFPGSSVEDISEMELSLNHFGYSPSETSAEQLEDLLNKALKTFPKESYFRRHHFSDKFGHYCKLCNVVYKGYVLFHLHMRHLHKMQKRFQCAVSSCMKSFASKSAFENHAKHHGQGLDFFCSVCDRVFVTEEEQIDHRNTEDHLGRFSKAIHSKYEPSNYQCKECKSWFGLKSFFIDHMETENHSYCCPYCNLYHSLSIDLRGHIEKEHSDKKHDCEICLTTLEEGDLQNHFASHGILQCTKCPRRYWRKDTLAIHAESHDPVDKTCEWPSCRMTFSSKGSFMKHKKMHAEDRRGRRRLSQRPLLHNQMASDTSVLQPFLSNQHYQNPLSQENNKSYQCPLCHSTFGSFQECQQHEPCNLIPLQSNETVVANGEDARYIPQEDNYQDCIIDTKGNEYFLKTPSGKEILLDKTNADLLFQQSNQYHQQMMGASTMDVNQNYQQEFQVVGEDQHVIPHELDPQQFPILQLQNQQAMEYYQQGDVEVDYKDFQYLDK